MNLIRIDPSDHHRVNQFLNLPFRLYADTPQWVPPLMMELRAALNPKKHPFYRHGDALFLLALDDQDQPLGRLAVLDNHAYNDFNHEKTAFFCLFECVDDQKVAGALFDAGFGWARSRGLTRITGPKGFTALDGMGLLVKGFEHRPALGQPYNHAYYHDLVAAAGFETAREVVSGYISRNVQFPEKIQRAAALVQKRYGIYVKRFSTKRGMLAMLPALLKLYNDSIVPGDGNVPMSARDLKSMSDQLLLFADPRLVKILMKEEHPIGFLLAYPDISAAIQRCKGRLFPFGWLGILMEPPRTDWLNINGAAILEEYQGMGGTAVLFNEMFKSILESRYEHAEVIQIGLDNARMQNELRTLGIDFYKMHRTYRKKL
ncbi:MAG: hypothetical protein WBV22_11490 [Anaerolineaceae bacterium]